MLTPDMINGCFELFGAIAILDHCRELYRAKRWEGFSILATIFFASWGYWNMFYYSNLEQWFSMVAGIMLAMCNTLWVYLLWFYRGEVIYENSAN
jgi:hypothetical protein